MSGGYFDYKEHWLYDIKSTIEEYINGKDLDEDEVEYVKKHKDWYYEEEYNYIMEHKHTLPNKYGYSEETLKEMQRGVEALKEAIIYVDRIDYLMEGDDSEESFHRRLKEDFKKKINEI